MQDDDTRTRILNAAGGAFAELGFKEATIREICRRADANLASVNYHFRDKERLYIETIKYAHCVQREKAVLSDWGEDTPAETKLRDFIRATTIQMLAFKGVPWQERLMLREMLQPTGACGELVEDFIRPQFELLLSILDEMVPEGTPVHKRHQLALSVVGQCLFYRFHDAVIRLLIPEAERGEQYGAAQLADHITDVILAALGRQGLWNEPARIQNEIDESQVYAKEQL